MGLGGGLKSTPAFNLRDSLLKANAHSFTALKREVQYNPGSASHRSRVAA